MNGHTVSAEAGNKTLVRTKDIKDFVRLEEERRTGNRFFMQVAERDIGCPCNMHEYFIQLDGGNVTLGVLVLVVAGGVEGVMEG